MVGGAENHFTPTTPIGYLNVGEAYRVGAQLLAKDLDGVGGWAGNPIRYLYYHAIETYLKAALISAGYTNSQLRSRKLGHSFGALVEAANSADFGLTETTDLAVIDLIDRDDNYLRARYHRAGAVQVVEISTLDGTAYKVAVLSAEMVRRSGVATRAPRRPLPYDFKLDLR